MDERQGEVAVVIGGTGALGREIAGELAAAGADVAFTFAHNSLAAERLEQTISAHGGRSHSASINLAMPGAVSDYIADVIRRFGRISSLFYAAGPPLGIGHIAKTSADEWRRVMDIDANGCFEAVRSVIPHLRQTRGSIVAIITSAVNRSTATDILSVAPKAAIQALIRGVAIEEGRFGVRANCVAPGFIETGLGQSIMTSIGPDRCADLVGQIPLRRIGTASEVAAAAMFLSSGRASYVTGNTLFVSGGMEL